MEKFVSILKSINNKIDLPQPMKSKILLEISADLNDLYELYLEQGFSEKEALKEAEKKIKLDDDSLNELIEIYNTGFYKWLHNISDRTRNKWERVFLILLMLFSLFFVGRIILTTDFFLMTSIFVLPVLTLSFFASVLLIIKCYKIFILKDHNVTRLRSNLPTILFFGGASLLAGVMGFFIDLYLTVSKIATDIKYTLTYFIDWLIRSSSYLIICLFLLIILSVIWYTIYLKITKIEYETTEYLINN